MHPGKNSKTIESLMFVVVVLKWKNDNQKALIDTQWQPRPLPADKATLIQLGD